MDSLKNEIEMRNAQFMKMYNKNDMKGVAMLYTEDCKVMASGCDVMIGREAVVAMFNQEYSSGCVNLVLEAKEVGPVNADSCAYEWGYYTFSDKDGKELDKGKYVVIWKKVSGQWHLYTDIFNTNKAA